MLVALLVPLTTSVVILALAILLRSVANDDLDEVFTFLQVSLVWTVVLGALAHAGAGLYRTRSPWIAVDLALLAVVAGSFYFVGRDMIDAGALHAALDAGLWLAGAVVVACLAAGFAQVAFGRSDPRRGHLALAAVLWGGLALCLGGATFFARWHLAPDPGDLQGRVVVCLGGGDHFLLSGFKARGRDYFAPWFVVDARDGGARRLGGRLSAVAISPNRRHAALVEGVLAPRLVLISSVAGQPPVVTRAALADRQEAWPLCLSDDGALAVIKFGSYSQVVDTATAKARPGPRLEAEACTFEGRSGVVLYRHDPSGNRLERSILDLVSGRFRLPSAWRGRSGPFPCAAIGCWPRWARASSGCSRRARAACCASWGGWASWVARPERS